MCNDLCKVSILARCTRSRLKSVRWRMRFPSILPPRFLRSRVSRASLLSGQPSCIDRSWTGTTAWFPGRLTLVGGKMRLTIRLVNDVTGYHVWAESFDGVASDELFAMQDRVADGVIAGVCPALISAEIDRLTAHARSALSPRGGDRVARALPFARWRPMSKARDSCLKRPRRRSTPISPIPWHCRSRRSVMRRLLFTLGTTATGREVVSRRSSFQAARRRAERSRRALSLTALAGTAAAGLGRPAEEIERLTIRACWRSIQL